MLTPSRSIHHSCVALPPITAVPFKTSAPRDSVTSVAWGWAAGLRLWNLGTGHLIATLEGQYTGVYALAVVPDGRLASGTEMAPSSSGIGITCGSHVGRIGAV